MTRLPLDRFSRNLRIFRIDKKKIHASLKSDKNNGYFTWIPIHFLVISHSVLLKTRNCSHKFAEKIKTHFTFTNFFFENRAVYDIMWIKLAELGRPQMTIWRIRIARWIHRATNKHSEHVMLIALPLQQRMHERVSQLRSTFIACLVFYCYSQFNGDRRTHATNQDHWTYSMWPPTLTFNSTKRFYVSVTIFL